MKTLTSLPLLPLSENGRRVPTAAPAAPGRETAQCGEIVVRKGEALTLNMKGNPRGLRIECRDGSAWITQTGDLRDIVLSAGDVSWLSGTGRVVVEGIGTAEAICWVSASSSG